jgi:hypothetical protein
MGRHGAHVECSVCHVVNLATLAALCALTEAQQVPGPSSCATHADFERLVEHVATSCCNQFDQEQNCADGIPQVCDTRCAPVYVEFWAACSSYITTNLPSPALRAQFVGVQGKCHATLQANLIHDTDLVKPGDQLDLSTPLLIPVNCHGQVMTTANELQRNMGPMDSLWSVMVDGDFKCLNEWRIVNPACTCAACPLTPAPGQPKLDSCHCVDGKYPGCTQASNHGWKTPEERDSCEALRNRHAVQAALEGRYGDCNEHRPPPPPPTGDVGHDLVLPVVHTVSTSGLAGHTTYQLVLQPPESQEPPSIGNIYTIYGSPAVTAGENMGEEAHVMYFPPAHQEPAPFGANLGGTNPAFWSYNPDTQWDSWLTVGKTDGSANQDISSIGIDFDSWTDTEGVTVENGAVFWMDPSTGCAEFPCTIAQITIETDAEWSATVHARGKMQGYNGEGGDDWEATNLIFSDATVPVWEDGGGEGQDEAANSKGRRLQEKGDPDGPPAEVAPGEGGMTNMICDYSLDTNLDGKVDDGDMLFSDLTFFEAILSKDAIFYLATDPLTAPILKTLECDEVFGGRRQM